MSFLWIDGFWLLLLVPALVLAYILLQRQRRKSALKYASLSLVKEALGKGPGIRRHIPRILFLVGLTAMIVALTRPVATVVLPSQQGTVILTIDVSMSMRATDLKPSRLDAAKSAARVFVEKQPKNVRIGVVLFSGSTAIVQAPTTDREAVLAAINRLTLQSRTAIGSGILTSLDAIFEEPGAKPKSSSSDLLKPAEPKSQSSLQRSTYAPAIILLLSDGQSNTGPRPLDIIDQAVNRGVRVYTVGVGNSAGALLEFGSYAVRVRLDEETLKSIAAKTDAKYFKADNEADLHDIYETLGTQLVFKPEQTELTAGFTGIAAVFVLIGGILSLLWFNRLP